MVKVVTPDVSKTAVFLPVTRRSERLGVLEVRLPRIDDQILTALDDTGRITAYALAAARRCTDRFERIRRRRDFLLAAEIQWELLPVLAYKTLGLRVLRDAWVWRRPSLCSAARAGVQRRALLRCSIKGLVDVSRMVGHGFIRTRAGRSKSDGTKAKVEHWG